MSWPLPERSVLGIFVKKPVPILVKTRLATEFSPDLAAERRPLAEWACWSSVHGFADIATHGPVRWQPAEVIDALAGAAVEAAITGVRGTSALPVEAD